MFIDCNVINILNNNLWGIRIFEKVLTSNCTEIKLKIGTCLIEHQKYTENIIIKIIWGTDTVVGGSTTHFCLFFMPNKTNNFFNFWYPYNIGKFSWNTDLPRLWDCRFSLVFELWYPLLAKNSSRTRSAFRTEDDVDELVADDFSSKLTELLGGFGGGSIICDLYTDLGLDNRFCNNRPPDLRRPLLSTGGIVFTSSSDNISICGALGVCFSNAADCDVLRCFVFIDLSDDCVLMFLPCSYCNLCLLTLTSDMTQLSRISCIIWIKGASFSVVSSRLTAVILEFLDLQSWMHLCFCETSCFLLRFWSLPFDFRVLLFWKIQSLYY